MSAALSLSVEQTLDLFHASASKADGDTYFGLFAAAYCEGVFIGTDANERWSVAEFRDYAMPRFQRGQGWTYRPIARNVSYLPDDNNKKSTVAWFDEILHHDRFGETRSSGVLIQEEDQWKIAQYHLTVPIPNDLMDKVAKLIRDDSVKSFGNSKLGRTLAGGAGAAAVAAAAFWVWIWSVRLWSPSRHPCIGRNDENYSSDEEESFVTARVASFQALAGSEISADANHPVFTEAANVQTPDPLIQQDHTKQPTGQHAPAAMVVSPHSHRKAHRQAAQEHTPDDLSSLSDSINAPPAWFKQFVERQQQMDQMIAQLYQMLQNFQATPSYARYPYQGIPACKQTPRMDQTDMTTIQGTLGAQCTNKDITSTPTNPGPPTNRHDPMAVDDDPNNALIATANMLNDQPESTHQAHAEASHLGQVPPTINIQQTLQSMTTPTQTQSTSTGRNPPVLIFGRANEHDGSFDTSHRTVDA